MKVTVKKDKDRVILGSGKLYIAERDDTALETALASPAATLAYCETLAIETNILGLISGGAAVDYTKSVQTITDDLELVGKTYVLLFVHEDKADGNVYVLITGKNTAGFKLEFKKEAATVIDATFTAEAMDNTGTKLVILEQIPQSGVLTITSAAGSTNGKTALTVTNTLGTGETYAYKTAVSLDMPAYLDAATVGAAAGNYTSWNGTDEITATTGNKLLLVVLKSNKVIKAGICTVTSKSS